MNWTNDKPISPGWYWWKQLRSEEPAIVKVSFIGDRLYLAFVAEYGTWDYDEIGRSESQFAGPIPPPYDHPVDALKMCGVDMLPEAEAQARAICDQLVPITNTMRALGVADFLKENFGVVLTVGQVADIAEHMVFQEIKRQPPA